jgi:hypothetical protein
MFMFLMIKIANLFLVCIGIRLEYYTGGRNKGKRLLGGIDVFDNRTGFYEILQ